VALVGNCQQQLGANDERATAIDEVVRLCEGENP